MTGTSRRDKGIPESLLRGQRVPLAKRIADLVDAMHRSVEAGQALNLSAAAHREITESLRILAYEPSPLPPQPSKSQLKVAYEDGSRPQKLALPVRCLTGSAPSDVDETQSLSLGTLSFRHLDYDEKIDLYLIRDRETRTLSNGEVHDLAYERMREVVSDPTLRAREASILLFQTGLEPLIVGLYSAVIEELVIRRANALPTLLIQPVFFADGDREARGQAWS